MWQNKIKLLADKGVFLYNNSMNEIQKELESKKDEKYCKFSQKIIPGQNVYVKMPEIKLLAKKYANTKAGEDYLQNLPHENIDQNNLHGIMLGYFNYDIQKTIQYLDKFLSYIDNWATCDCTVSAMKIFKKYPKIAQKQAKIWLKSDKIFTKRFAIVILLDYCLDKNFEKEDLDLLNFLSQDYYVNMALAWYYSVALVKQYDSVIGYFENKKLVNNFVHNKAIQKACESFRISDDKKSYLKTLKVF